VKKGRQAGRKGGPWCSSLSTILGSFFRKEKREEGKMKGRMKDGEERMKDREGRGWCEHA
jgi:hypothetical protein